MSLVHELLSKAEDKIEDGQPDVAQTYALFAIATALDNISGDLGKIADSLGTIATETGGIAVAISERS